MSFETTWSATSQMEFDNHIFKTTCQTSQKQKEIVMTKETPYPVKSNTRIPTSCTEKHGSAEIIKIKNGKEQFKGKNQANAKAIRVKLIRKEMTGTKKWESRKKRTKKYYGRKATNRYKQNIFKKNNA